MEIDSFAIDFDGDNKKDNEIDTNPAAAGGITFTFDKVRTYRPVMIYTGTDKTTGKESNGTTSNIASSKCRGIGSSH